MMSRVVGRRIVNGAAEVVGIFPKHLTKKRRYGRRRSVGEIMKTFLEAWRLETDLLGLTSCLIAVEVMEIIEVERRKKS